MKLPPLSLYMHLPWCVKKCPYCDFNSHRAGDSPPKQRYIEALLVDLGRESRHAAGRRIESIFLGGGTPSLFSPEEIASLLQAVRTGFELAPDCEVSMEANPGTVDCGSPAGYLDAGVTRLSIGAQSFDDEQLSQLGRIHGRADIHRTVTAARDGGFENFNIDLMHGLPGQTVAGALADLGAAIELQPAHLSWYQLTLEPNTIFYARPPANLPDNDLASDIQTAGQELLAAKGFEQYEVSAYASDARFCRHNLNYWQFGDYLAVGAGAHGKLTSSEGIFRYQKAANPMQYMHSQEAGDPDLRLREVTPADRLFEFMLNALRLTAGFSEALFVERTALPADALMAASADARGKGLLERSAAGWWRPTPLGSRFLDDLQAGFIAREA